LAARFRLAGIVAIHDAPGRKWRALRAERRRTGWMGAADAIAFRALYALTRRTRDREWITATVGQLRERYPGSLDQVPAMTTSSPNSAEAKSFIRACAPDLVVARCKHLLSHEVFSLPRAGTVVFHPGICPEYRNAHGCFWALVNRDLTRVGMTVLTIDRGVDTGAVFLHARYTLAVQQETHIVVQYRVVNKHLYAIERVLVDLSAGHAQPISTAGRTSAVWGQPRLSSYLRWRRAVRRAHRDTHDLFPVS